MLLCAALRASMQLERVWFANVTLWRDMVAASALLASLHAHPTLRRFSLFQNAVPPGQAAAAGAAIGALIVTLPYLDMLDIIGCQLGDAGLGTIVDALPQVRRLHTLYITGNNMSEAFACERLLPIVHACASLRHLFGDDTPEEWLHDVERTLSDRRRAARAAAAALR